jgi:thiamine-monophosphate kinase
MPEFEFINWVRRRVTDRPPVRLGIGDDAAVLDPSARSLLVTTDMLMEGVDFTFPQATPELAGRKSLAVNLSDLAAMGGVPTTAFVSIALPQERGQTFAESFFRGFLELADEFGVILAGGDTNTWDQPLVASVTLLGHPAGKSPIPRSGAQPGDWILVTGELGGSIHGHHLTFTPRIREAQQLVSLVPVHAMIDISDGLAADLHHVLSASSVGAVIDARQIPLRDLSGGRPLPEHADPSRERERPASGPRPGIDLQHALSDGEDFELLFTVSPKDGALLERDWPGPTRLTRIGEITRDRECWLKIEGGQTKLPPLGWRHDLS